jgi:hypothetical protein
LSLQELRNALRQRMNRRHFDAEVDLVATGLALDGPRLNRTVSPGAARACTIENSTAWIWKPRVTVSPGGPELGWGGVVVVSGDGCRRLASRVGMVQEVQ